MHSKRKKFSTTFQEYSIYVKRFFEESFEFLTVNFLCIKFLGLNQSSNEKMKNKLIFLSSGFALFSMFFGSGNLVFPLVLGKENLSHYPFALLGLFLTAVLVPILGVLAMMLFKGQAKAFFSVMGERAAFWMSLVILSLMGPFGVLARCITVAHGSCEVLFPDVTLMQFSLVFSLFTFIIALNKERIVPILGSFLTPFLLLALGLIAGFGFFYGAPPMDAQNPPSQAFQDGFFKGYQMMDLLASFFFSAFIIDHINARVKEENQVKTFLVSSCIGGSLLFVVYAALTYLGASFAPLLATVPPEKALGVVAEHTLGSYSLIAVVIASVLACLTTAVVLASLFADFLKKEVTDHKLSNSLSLIMTLCIAYFVSLLQFSGIAKILGPILEVIYPALIVLTLVNIASHFFGTKKYRWPVIATILLRLATSI